jgi:hypothetical protein
MAPVCGVLLEVEVGEEACMRLCDRAAREEALHAAIRLHDPDRASFELRLPAAGLADDDLAGVVSDDCEPATATPAASDTTATGAKSQLIRRIASSDVVVVTAGGGKPQLTPRREKMRTPSTRRGRNDDAAVSVEVQLYA